VRRVLALAFAALLLACGGEGGVKRYQAHGVVEEVQPDYGQVVIAHDDIPGLMPAMTMNFDADPALLSRLEAGQVIDFTLASDGRSYRVTEAHVSAEVEPKPGWARMGKRLVRAQPAPPFALTDQDDRPAALSDWKGQAVLLDFIYTRCPGPCPILTGVLVDVQKALPPQVRAHTHFASISMDPTHDTPEVLARYARARGADLSDWSFLTGPQSQVEKVLAAYGVGSTRRPDGTIDHLVATFLIDGQGRIVETYLGLEHQPADLVADLEELLSTPAAS
jgi:protein SCO1/2